MENTAELTTVPVELTKRAKLFLILLFLFSFLTFFVIKLPHDQIHSLLVKNGNHVLQPMGYVLQSSTGGLSVGFHGVHYRLDDVRIVSATANKLLKLGDVSVAPLYLSLMQGKIGFTFLMASGGGESTGNFSSSSTELKLNLNFDKMNLGKIGVFPFFLGSAGTVVLDGQVDTNLHFDDPALTTGQVDLKLAQWVMDDQKIQGIALPRLSIKESILKVKIENGLANLNQVEIGKSPEDDIRAKLRGTVKLAKNISNSQVDIRAELKPSAALMTSVSFLSGLLASFKKGEDTYAVRLQGSLYGIIPTPDAGP